MGRQRGGCERRRERPSDEDPFFAAGASFKIPAGELMEEVLPGLGEDFFFLVILVIRFLPLEKGSGFFEFGFGVAGSQETVVADFDEASGQHMEEEAPDKLLGGECHLSGIFGCLIISGLEGHVAVLAVD
jgi:hypothetical protein